jgi:hypothetical protein
MVPGRLVNGSMGNVIGFITVSEATDQDINISHDPTKETEPNKQFLQRMKRIATRVKGEDERMEALTSSQFTEETAWPLVQFDNNDKMLFVLSTFRGIGIRGNIEVEREQVGLIKVSPHEYS